MSYKKKNTLEIQGDCTVTYRSKLILGERVKKYMGYFHLNSYHGNLEFLITSVREWLQWAKILSVLVVASILGLHCAEDSPLVTR